MEVYNDRLCLTGEEVWAVLGSNFNTLLSRGRVRNLLGRACYNRSALYDVDDFPNNKKNRYRDELYQAYPELTNWKAIREAREFRSVLIENIVPDPKAGTFFAEHKKPNGDTLKPEEIRRYVHSAMLLNAIRRTWENSYSLHARAGKVRKMRIGDFFVSMSKAMPDVLNHFKGELSFKRFNSRRLKELYDAYGDNSYASLLSGKTGNQNRTKKHKDMITRIVLSIYANEAKLFKTDVTRIYNEFVLGLREIYVEGTGEVFDRNDFYHNGEPETISDGLVFNIIESPLNRKIVDKIRNDFHYNQQHHNVSIQRKSPDFSLSKISADDRDLVRRCVVTDGKGNKKLAIVHAYYIYDVASGCIIGTAHSLKKDINLVMSCYRNMWNNLRSWGCATPIEMEVENHLMKGTEIEQKLHNTFTNVTICAPMNSREKRAEQFNKAKKYYGEYAEFKMGMAKGRHNAKHEAYLSHREKIFDEANDTYREQLEAKDFDFVVAEDLAQIKLYNNARHTALKDRKAKELKYGGMTRMQVLQMRQNTQAGMLNWRLICKEWGVVRETSLKQGAKFTVDYREWWLSDAELIKRFAPHNTNTLAYFIPDNNNEITEIYIYQGDRFIDTPRDLGTFQEAIAERTEEDLHIMHRQMGYKSSQKALGKETARELLLGKIGSLKTETVNAAILRTNTTEITGTSPPIGEEPVPELVEEYAGYDLEDYAAKALNSM